MPSAVLALSNYARERHSAAVCEVIRVGEGGALDQSGEGRRPRCRWGGLWAAANPQILSLTNFAGWRLAAISEKVDNTNLWPLRQTRKALMQPACLLESDWVNSTSYLRSPLLIQSSMTRSNCTLQSVSVLLLPVLHHCQGGVPAQQIASVSRIHLVQQR